MATPNNHLFDHSSISLSVTVCSFVRLFVELLFIYIYFYYCCFCCVVFWCFFGCCFVVGVVVLLLLLFVLCVCFCCCFCCCCCLFCFVLFFLFLFFFCFFLGGCFFVLINSSSVMERPSLGVSTEVSISNTKYQHTGTNWLLKIKTCYLHKLQYSMWHTQEATRKTARGGLIRIQKACRESVVKIQVSKSLLNY